MTKVLTASVTIVLTVLVFVSYRAFEENRGKFINSLALSIMASLVEIETNRSRTAEAERVQDGILIADAAEHSPVLQARERIATRVVPLPPLKPLPKPLCTARPPVQLARYQAGAERYRHDLFRWPQVHTEVHVITEESSKTRDWTKLIASCREKSLKVCIDKSKTRQRVVILDSKKDDAVSSAIATIEQPVI